MRASKFKPQDYAQRFAEGIAFYKGLPYRVAVEGAAINLYSLEDGEAKHRNVNNHDDLDVSSPPLGYINTRYGAVYITRIPRRRYKQCIDNQSVEESILGVGGHQGPADRIGRIGVLFTKDFYNSYANSYPTLEQAVRELNKEKPSVALSKEFAVTLDELGIVKVWYKYDQIGWIDPSNLKVCKVPDTEKGFLISYYLSNSFGWEIE